MSQQLPHLSPSQAETIRYYAGVGRIVFTRSGPSCERHGFITPASVDPGTGHHYGRSATARGLAALREYDHRVALESQHV